jgi:hypothetical protein
MGSGRILNVFDKASPVILYRLREGVGEAAAAKEMHGTARGHREAAAHKSENPK